MSLQLLESNVDGSVSVGANVHNGEKLTLMSTTKSQQIERVTGTITNQMKELGPLKVRGGCVNYAHSCVRLLGSDIQTFCQRMSAVLSRGAFLGMCTSTIAFLNHPHFTNYIVPNSFRGVHQRPVLYCCRRKSSILDWSM